MIEVPIQCLPHGRGLPLPTYATEDSAGLDLRAAVAQPTILLHGYRAVIPTGIAIAVPRGYEGQIRARSGLAARNGVTVLNGPGTIDADFRGEIKVVLANFGADRFEVTRGMRIAQLVIAPVARIAWRPVEALSGTERGPNGFGSTGKDSAAE